MMWRKYKRRVLLAMSSQAFAQLVRCYNSSPTLIRGPYSPLTLQNGINGKTLVLWVKELETNPSDSRQLYLIMRVSILV